MRFETFFPNPSPYDDILGMSSLRPGGWLIHGLRVIATLPILLYRYLISPLLPQTCIYHPSCSSYAQHAILKHGLFRGLALGISRVFRCSSFFTGGYDPVPEHFSFDGIRMGYREHSRRNRSGAAEPDGAAEPEVATDRDAAAGPDRDGAQTPDPDAQSCV